MDKPSSSNSGDMAMASLNSEEGLLRLLSFNNELVLNIVRLMNKDKEGNGDSCIQASKLLKEEMNASRNKLRPQSPSFKRPHDVGTVRSIPVTEKIEIPSKRPKTLEPEVPIIHHPGELKPALSPKTNQTNPACINPIMALQNQVAAQKEEIAMLRRKIGTMRATMSAKNCFLDISKKAAESQKHPHEVDCMLHEVMNLHATFMNLIDNLCRGDREGPKGKIDDDLLEFRAEVNGLFEQAHRKLSCWRKNQHEMYEELQITKQLLFNSLTQIISETPRRHNQIKSFGPTLTTPPPYERRGSAFSTPNKPASMMVPCSSGSMGTTMLSPDPSPVLKFHHGPIGVPVPPNFVGNIPIPTYTLPPSPVSSPSQPFLTQYSPRATSGSSNMKSPKTMETLQAKATRGSPVSHGSMRPHAGAFSTFSTRTTAHHKMLEQFIGNTSTVGFQQKSTAESLPTGIIKPKPIRRSPIQPSVNAQSGPDPSRPSSSQDKTQNEVQEKQFIEKANVVDVPQNPPPESQKTEISNPKPISPNPSEISNSKENHLEAGVGQSIPRSIATTAKCLSERGNSPVNAQPPPSVSPETVTDIGTPDANKSFICESCGASVSTLVQLRLHKKVVH